MNIFDYQIDLSDPVFNDLDTDPDFNPNKSQSMLSLYVTHIHSNLNNFFKLKLYFNLFIRTNGMLLFIII